MKKSLLILVFILGTHSVAFGQWVQTNGPYGGHIGCFGKGNSHIVAGTSDENGHLRIFRSSDNGLSWIASGNNVPDSVGFWCLSNIGARLLAGTREGVFISTDDGSSWNECESGLTDSTIMTLVVMDSFVFAASDGGNLFFSSDSGEQWTEVNSKINGNILSMTILGSSIFAGTYASGILQSTDGGKNWTPTNNGLNYSYITSLSANDSLLFAGGNNGALYLSLDSGSSWNMINDTSTQKMYRPCVTLKDSNIFVGSLEGLFRTNNGGLSWQEVDSGFVTDEISAIFASGQTILAGTAEGVYISSNNGSSWIYTGVPVLETTFLATEGPNLYSCSYYEPMFVSGDGGKTWTSHSDAAATSMTAIGTTVFAGYNDNSNGVFISTDSGNSWTYSTPISSNNGVSSLASIDSNLFALTDVGIFLSTDFGESWQNVSGNTGIDNNVYSSAYAMGAADSNLFIFGGSSYLSTDLGLDWTKINVVVTPSIQWTAPTFTQCEGDVFVVDRFEGIMRSTDNGITWQGVNAGLPDSIAISSLASIDNYVFAGSVGRGVFVTPNFGETWTAINSGLSDTEIFSLAVKDSFLYAGTGSSGVWQLPLSGMPKLSYILDVKNPENDTIFFDTIPIGQTSLRTVTASNAGNGKLTIQPIQAPQNGFATSDVSSQVILDSGESFTFEAYFQPTTPGLHSAQLNLLSEAREVTIYLFGLATGQADVNNSSLQTGLQLNAYPNPLSQSATIRFTSAESGVARVTIVNLLGEEVARVFEGTLSAGEHNFQWSKPADLPNGMYECVVEINRRVQQVPMLVQN